MGEDQSRRVPNLIEGIRIMPDRLNVLIVDDEINILRALQRLLRKEQYNVLVASSAKEGIAQVSAHRPALVISDYIMPDQNGLEFLKQEQSMYPDTIRVILSGYADLDAIVHALNSGQIHHYITKPWEDELLKIEIRKYLEQWSLLKRHREMHQTMQFHVDAAVEVLSALPQIKDPQLAGEAERVRQICLVIGQAYPLPPEALRDLEVAAKLHKVGNIGVSSEILNKPGMLTPQERREVEQHVIIPQVALQPMKIFERPCQIIRNHHEFFDGNGYPDQLKGDHIPIASRILCVAEAFDALRSSRPFRAALSSEEAMEMIKKKSGSLFDPKIVHILMQQIRISSPSFV